MHENSHWYCMLGNKTFLPHLVINDNEFKYTVIRKQVKFTHIAKPAISDTENFIKAINSRNNISKYFTIKDLNSTFNDIGSPFSLFHLNIVSSKVFSPLKLSQKSCPPLLLPPTELSKFGFPTLFGSPTDL